MRKTMVRNAREISETNVENGILEIENKKNIMLVGNANTGKTTLLNKLTRSEEHTGNWHGVTVEEKVKFYTHNKKKYSVVDLPGIYSLTALSLEEQVAIDYIFSHKDNLILNTCDANNLHRNLYLTLELLQYGANVILLINTMGDNFNIDIKKIKKELGIEVELLNFDNKNEVLKLKDKIEKRKKDNTQSDIFKKVYSKETYNCIKEVSLKLKLNMFETIKLIEKDDFFAKKTQISDETIKNIKINLTSLAEQKFEYIKSFCNYNQKKKAYGEEFLDKIILNKFLAIPIFFAIMLLIFYLTFFSIGAFFSNILSIIILDYLGNFIIGLFQSFCSVEWINGLIEHGLIGGVGTIATFLPQIVFLFLFLAILEDSGYFSRIAFCFEDLLNKVGLSGKSVYTLLMGFGCSASAVLTARNLDNHNAKVKTAILTPYMSCSAKLPIYAVLGGAFFGAGNILIIFLLYLLGVFVSLFVSIVLDKFGLKANKSVFILEFPPYRIPKGSRILKLIWFNMKIFLIKVTTIFISVNVIVWCLSSFSFDFSYVLISGEKSMLQILGETLAPLFIPLGFNNWGAVSALLAGFVAKEIVVSSIAIFNGININSNDMNNQVSQSVLNPDSAVYFTSASAISYMSFCLLYCPCLATIAILKKEIGIKWTLISALIQLVIAYIIAFMVFNLYCLVEVMGIVNAIFLILFVFLILISIINVWSYLMNKNKCKKCGYCN
ncbi:MAG: ferrous iron transport protein B [Clostridia bacterium]|nr:ferrous iron transport protein B [Clostridia bacterium]